MKSNCKSNRYCCPDGIWEIDNLVGAKVAIRSTGIGNFTTCMPSGEFKIKEIYFRVSVDGKAITLVKLEGLDDEFFTFKDLEILSVVKEPSKTLNSSGMVIGNDTTI